MRDPGNKQRKVADDDLDLYALLVSVDPKNRPRIGLSPDVFAIGRENRFSE